MSNITDIKSVLTQKVLDFFCHKFHFPDDDHPKLPSPNQTIHEIPARKIGVYTRFLEYANFQLPLSTFLFNVLRHYRINLSQLLVITAAKVSHFEILCRVHSIEPMVGLFRCFYINSKNKGWMYFSKRPDSDAHTDKNISRDPFLKSTEFNADDYVVLVANPAPFWKFSEPFLCLVGMSHNYTMDEDTYLSFLHEDGTVVDPTKVRVVERERAEGEEKLMDSTVGRVVPLLPGDFATGGGQDAETELVTGVKIIVDENVVAERPKRPRKKRPVVMDASELLASSILNVEVGVIAVATLPLVTSSVSATPKRESDAPTDSITKVNLYTIGASKRFVISSDSSHHSSTNASGAKGDSIIRFAVVPPVMTEAVVTSHVVNDPSVSVPDMGTKITSLVHASMFHDPDSTKTVKADAMGPSYSAKQDLSMGSLELNVETLHQVFVPLWNVLNDSLLDDSDVSREFVDHLAPPTLFSQICEMDYHHLFTKFNVRTARQACLNAEARDNEVENLKAQLLLKETEAAEAACLRAQVSTAEATEKMHVDEIDALKQRNMALENEKDSLYGKVIELQSSVSAKDLKLKDLNVVVSSLKSQNDGLVDQVHALETTCSSLRDQVSGYEQLKEQIEEFQDA
ncbi:hypothetical protein Tco_1218673 [Tanacetum coccineum]